MSRPKLLAAGAAALLVTFLLGFVPQWLRARNLERELQHTRSELALSRLEGRLGAALSESMRGNYERARQLMTGFFSELQGRMPRVGEAERAQELETVLAQRDEIITLLSRAQPESTQRLMLLFTRYFAAVNPAGWEAGAAVTPSPPATPAETPAAERDEAVPPS